MTPAASRCRSAIELKNPEYAATLRLLAEKGAEAMYSGELAAAIANRGSREQRAAGPA